MSNKLNFYFYTPPLYLTNTPTHLIYSLFLLFQHLSLLLPQTHFASKPKNGEVTRFSAQMGRLIIIYSAQMEE